MCITVVIHKVPVNRSVVCRESGKWEGEALAEPCECTDTGSAGASPSQDAPIPAIEFSGMLTSVANSNDRDCGGGKVDRLVARNSLATFWMPLTVH